MVMRLWPMDWWIASHDAKGEGDATVAARVTTCLRTVLVLVLEHYGDSLGFGAVRI
jgi:hypothetical protein